MLSSTIDAMTKLGTSPVAADTTGHLVVPKSMTLIVLPSRAPELSPPELVEG